jgi:hypothetical protein
MVMPKASLFTSFDLQLEPTGQEPAHGGHRCSVEGDPWPTSRMRSLGLSMRPLSVGQARFQPHPRRQRRLAGAAAANIDVAVTA